jgi:creatinine amidohydrolase/Fe(II)-dependent formamide hydrolase-like protein
MTENLSIESLIVIDRLEVGPISVTPDSVKAPYTIHMGSQTDTIELVYKYEESVFSPDDWETKNLATLISVQVAMNYGLFCREIALNGNFDTADGRFLEEMLENTSREIYVNKLLHPNPFLRSLASEIKPEKRHRYTQATLHLEEVNRNGRTDQKWTTDHRRHAVLLSGGKDSLLTHSLLEEIGVETHPVFINESGRHWYTALNAYRHFEKKVAHTTRVWTNADRVFTWMLRHLPFIRPDFANVRADIYPIRLWTVAIFLFGALPILRARGIGRLLIGNEFDTTVRAKHEGIAHFDGLYDQSRYFDNALTRLFLKKGYGIAQFSILRHLSELLIQRILAERYPSVQTLQVSCHAAHIVGDRVYPCGKCEKCRRIVAMLLSVGKDPATCGYTNAQISAILEDLPRHPLHQEAAGVSHLMHLLIERALIEPTSLDGVKAKERKEVVRMRFDKERSPVDLIPNDLRTSLYSIMLAHTEGAVVREAKRWAPFDPLTEISLTTPYRFERPTATTQESNHMVTRNRYLLGELTWKEARAKLKEVDIALFPVGSIEQHGPHLPLDVDAFDAERLCLDVAEMCSEPKPFVLPLLPYGVSYHHDEFPGTISISPGTLSQLTVDVGMSVARQGITKLIIVNGHGGNGPALHFAAQMINRDAHIFTCVDTGETSDTEIAPLAETLNDVHAGEVETSTTLALRPELVQMALAKKSVPRFSSDYLEFSSKKSIEWYVRTRRISQTGVLGDPTKATAKKGRLMWDIMVKNLTRLVEDLKSLTLDEIYQRRY